MSVKYIHDEVIHNTRAASFLVPEMIRLYNPKSIVDVGCGIGTWLSVFDDLGVKDYIGIDGDYIDKSLLMIAENKFVPADLNERISLDRKFDIAISLEVAEHLENTSAEIFIRSLTELSDTIIFSAAIPGQGGQNHLNEQYPTFWQNLFLQLDYILVNSFSKYFWNNDLIEWWYRQNILVFKKNPQPEEIVDLELKVHPELYKKKLEEIENLSLKLHNINNGNIKLGQFLKIMKSYIVSKIKT